MKDDQLTARSTLFAQRTESAAGTSQYVTGWGYWDHGLRYTFITQQAGDCTHRLPLLLKAGDLLTFADGSTFDQGDADREIQTSSLVLTRDGHRVLFSLGTRPLRVFVKRTGQEIAGGVIHRIGILFEKQLDLGIVFLSADPDQTVQAEAHRHASGDISMRVTTLPRLRGAKLSIAGAVYGAQLIVPDVADYCVSEQTLRASEARARSLSDELLIVTATAPDGSAIITSETPIV